MRRVILGTLYVLPMNNWNSSHKNTNLLKIYSLSGHPGYRWVCSFIWTDLETFSIASALLTILSSTANGCRQTVASVPISIISLSPVKKSSCLNPERNTVCTDYKRKQSKTNMLVDFDLRGQQRMEFFTGGSVFMDYGLVCDHRDSFVNICPYWETKFCR